MTEKLYRKRPAEPTQSPRPKGTDAAFSGGMTSLVDGASRKDLPEAMRTKMENAFGADFSHLQIYESEKVAEGGARAVTQGNAIAFAPGEFNPYSPHSEALLGHELSHVVSQARGEARGNGLLDNSYLEAKADREGVMAAAGQQVYTGPVTPLSPSSPMSVAGPMQCKKNKKNLQPDEGSVPSYLKETAQSPRKKSGGPFAQRNNLSGDALNYIRAYDSSSDFLSKNNDWVIADQTVGVMEAPVQQAPTMQRLGAQYPDASSYKVLNNVKQLSEDRKHGQPLAPSVSHLDESLFGKKKIPGRSMDAKYRLLLRNAKKKEQEMNDLTEKEKAKNQGLTDEEITESVREMNPMLYNRMVRSQSDLQHYDTKRSINRGISDANRKSHLFENSIPEAPEVEEEDITDPWGTLTTASQSKDEKKIDKAYEMLSDEQNSDITAQQRDEVNRYIDDSKDYNDYLRSGGTNANQPGDIRERVDRLGGVMKPMKSPLTTYRGVSDYALIAIVKQNPELAKVALKEDGSLDHKALMENKELLTGMEYTDLGFGSTSVNEGYAEKWRKGIVSREAGYKNMKFLRDNYVEDDLKNPTIREKLGGIRQLKDVKLDTLEDYDNLDAFRKNVVMYKALSKLHGSDPKLRQNWETGESLSKKGFGSHMFQINVPEGAEGAMVDKMRLNLDGTPANAKQKELLLNRGTRYKINGLEQLTDEKGQALPNQYRILMEVIKKNKKKANA